MLKLRFGCCVASNGGWLVGVGLGGKARQQLCLPSSPPLTVAIAVWCRCGGLGCDRIDVRDGCVRAGGFCLAREMCCAWLEWV